ncbi:hypothetical protein M758_UG064200 [Ceratodon purpureus]|nr:hypothetical protein M758_UG064200 [Ceratodon purpureus]
MILKPLIFISRLETLQLLAILLTMSDSLLMQHFSVLCENHTYCLLIESCIHL